MQGNGRRRARRPRAWLGVVVAGDARDMKAIAAWLVLTREGEHRRRRPRWRASGARSSACCSRARLVGRRVLEKVSGTEWRQSPCLAMLVGVLLSFWRSLLRLSSFFWAAACYVASAPGYLALLLLPALLRCGAGRPAGGHSTRATSGHAPVTMHDSQTRRRASADDQ